MYVHLRGEFIKAGTFDRCLDLGVMRGLHFKYNYLDIKCIIRWPLFPYLQFYGIVTCLLNSDSVHSKIC